MKFAYYALVSILLILFGSGCKIRSKKHFSNNGNKNYIVLVSLDGCRWDYPSIHGMKNINSIGKEGVHGIMKPSYPSSTFPNHYTIATGLVPDHHGIINNKFWDQTHNATYAISDSATRNNPLYYGGEPIWITAQKQHIKTASIYWIGSDIAIQATLPTYYKVWADEPRLSFNERVDEVIRLLEKEDKDRPQLIMVYFEEPDGTGHHHGPVSVETKRMAQQVDQLMGELWQRIKKLQIGDKVNLIILSDHGMTDISDKRFYNVDKYIKPEWVYNISGATPTNIYTRPGCRDSVVNALSNLENITVWKREDVPARFQYGENKNCGDVIVAPTLGWQFSDTPRHLKGAHGYDPEEKDMQVLFRAIGPNFKKSYKMKNPFPNVDIYPLLCYLLQISPAKNDGNIKDILPMLK